MKQERDPVLTIVNTIRPTQNDLFDTNKYLQIFPTTSTISLQFLCKQKRNPELHAKSYCKCTQMLTLG